MLLRFVRHFLLAIQFFTRIPITGRLAEWVGYSPAMLRNSAAYFPAVGWMFWQGDTGWAMFLLVWSLVVVSLDNFLRPMLIKRGADLPLLLIFAGVIGGLLSFGLIGIFVGPVALAVTYTLVQAWVSEPNATNTTEAAS